MVVGFCKLPYCTRHRIPFTLSYWILIHFLPKWKLTYLLGLSHNHFQPINMLLQEQAREGCNLIGCRADISSFARVMDYAFKDILPLHWVLSSVMRFFFYHFVNCGRQTETDGKTANQIPGLYCHGSKVFCLQRNRGHFGGVCFSPVLIKID